MNKIVIGIVIAFIFIGLVLFFCVILIRLYFIKIKKYSQLLYQKDLDFQKILTTTVMETYEQAANNISSDLHDDTGQQLTVINLQLENLKYDSPELQKALAPVSDSLNSLSQSIRSISHSLNNQLVVQQDLLKGIASEVERLKNRTGSAVDFSLQSKAKREFTTNEKIIIYRIFQECINNSFKHAKATHITVDIKVAPKFEMKIKDNGVGFDAMKKTGKSSLGILTMNNRANEIGYQLVIDAAPGQGTTIILSETKTS